MPRYGAEEAYVPMPDWQRQQLMLSQMDQARREQIANIQGLGDLQAAGRIAGGKLVGQAISNATEGYLAGAEHARRNKAAERQARDAEMSEETHALSKEEKGIAISKAKAEQEWLDKKDPNSGRTNREALADLERREKESSISYKNYLANQPKETKTRVIETVDPKTGEPVQMVVVDRPGASYPMAPKSNEAKGDQFKAAGFARRMEQAEKNINELASTGFDRTSVKVGLQSSGPDFMKSEALKRHEQAETNFISAVLRRESGANITKDERESAEKQYFPRVGDTPEVLEQKRQNRALAIQSLEAEAGPAMKQVPSVEAIAGSRTLPTPQPAGGTAYAAPSRPMEQMTDAEIRAEIEARKRGGRSPGASGGY